MSDNADILRQRRRAENANRPRQITQVATIGQRSSNGRYDVVMPDGGIMAGRANKIYNANHNAGDTVIALPRRDGVILLEGPKATVEPDPKVNPLDLAALVDRCDRYLNGQIFNCAQEAREKFGKLQILYSIGSGNQIAYYVGGFQKTAINVGTIAQGWWAASLENNGLADFTVGFFRVVDGGRYERRFVRWIKGAASDLYQADSGTSSTPFLPLTNPTEPDVVPGLTPNISGMKNTSGWGSISTSGLRSAEYEIGLNDSIQITVAAQFWMSEENGQDDLNYQVTTTAIDDRGLPPSSAGGRTTRLTRINSMTGVTSILPGIKRAFNFQANLIDDSIADPDISLFSESFNFAQRLIHEVDLSTALVVRANWTRDFDGNRVPALIRLNVNTLSLISADGVETPFPASLKISDLQAFAPGEGANANNQTTAAISILDFWNLHESRLYTFDPTTEIVKIWGTEAETPETLKPQYFPPQEGAHILSAQYRP